MAVLQLIWHVPFYAMALSMLSNSPVCIRGQKKAPLSYIAGNWNSLALRMRLQCPGLPQLQEGFAGHHSPHLSQTTQSLSAKHTAELEGPLLCTKQHLSPQT